jgi:hypothetical protein
MLPLRVAIRCVGASARGFSVGERESSSSFALLSAVSNPAGVAESSIILPKGSIAGQHLADDPLARCKAGHGATSARLRSIRPDRSAHRHCLNGGDCRHSHLAVWPVVFEQWALMPVLAKPSSQACERQLRTSNRAIEK